MFKRIDHVEIIPRDMDVTIGFYTDVLGFRLTSRFPVPVPPLKEVAYLQLGDTALELMAFESADDGNIGKIRVGYHAVALEVEDMARTVEYLKSKGVTISREPVDLGTSLRGEFLDPDGLTIELRQWKAGAQRWH